MSHRINATIPVKMLVTTLITKGIFVLKTANILQAYRAFPLSRPLVNVDILCIQSLN